MKNQNIPAELRPLIKRIAFSVYDSICADVPEVENYSMRAQVEIVRDAGRLSGALGMGGFIGRNHPEVKEWLKVHEYDPAFSQDLNRAVREALTGK